MKKILFLLMVALMATTAIKAQNNNATLLQPAGSYIYYGDQAFNLKQCVDFLATTNNQQLMKNSKAVTNAIKLDGDFLVQV
jgi:hypothetical protein